MACSKNSFAIVYVCAFSKRQKRRILVQQYALLRTAERYTALRTTYTTFKVYVHFCVVSGDVRQIVSSSKISLVYWGDLKIR